MPRKVMPEGLWRVVVTKEGDESKVTAIYFTSGRKSVYTFRVPKHPQKGVVTLPETAAGIPNPTPAETPEGGSGT